MAVHIYRGKVWKCGDQVDTYQILPKEYWMGNIGELDEKKLAKAAMAGYDKNFGDQALNGEIQFILAGKNFGGGGKSIEHPIYALKGAGVQLILAESVSRYFFRNLFNNGLPVIIQEGVSEIADTGDEIEVDLEKGEIRNISKKKDLSILPIPKFLLEMVEVGGYVNYVKNKISAN